MGYPASPLRGFFVVVPRVLPSLAVTIAGQAGLFRQPPCAGRRMIGSASMSAARLPTSSGAVRGRAASSRSSSQGVSTPHDQSQACRGHMKVCGMAGVEPGAIDAVFHGTTVATNMVIERRRRGRHDHDARLPRHPAHARHKRPHNFSLQFDVPWQSKPLIKRRNRIAVSDTSCRRLARSPCRLPRTR